MRFLTGCSAWIRCAIVAIFVLAVAAPPYSSVFGIGDHAPAMAACDCGCGEPHCEGVASQYGCDNNPLMYCKEFHSSACSDCECRFWYNIINNRIECGCVAREIIDP